MNQREKIIREVANYIGPAFPEAAKLALECLAARVEEPNPIERDKDLIIAAISEGSEQWRAEYDNCREILKELVNLKVLKDSKGKTEYYLQNQPLLWEKAIKFLDQYQHF